MRAQMREKTCCFTGHRRISPAGTDKIKAQLRAVILQLIDEGVQFFGSGGAMGFDTIAAETVLEIKKEHPQIKLIMVYPCRDQTKYWPESEVRRHGEIKKNCDKYVYICEKYHPECLRQRNCHLVECSRYCVCYQIHSGGGTDFTVKYARKKGLTVINLAEFC